MRAALPRAIRYFGSVGNTRPVVTDRSPFRRLRSAIPDFVQNVRAYVRTIRPELFDVDYGLPIGNLEIGIRRRSFSFE